MQVDLQSTGLVNGPGKALLEYNQIEVRKRIKIKHKFMEEKEMWAYESVFYQIYPLGFCGAPFENDGALEHRILKVLDWIPHMSRLGINAVYFSPLFESDTSLLI